MEQTTGSFDKSAQAIVPLDGLRARKIRESKKLTQLYVANVVGVTTDTISRWENNRYPTIKRDNAEKLASALEVPIEEILRQEEEPVPAEEPVPVSEKRGGNKGVLLAILILAAVVVAGFLLLKPEPGPPLAVRLLPGYAAPAAVVPVQVKVERMDETVQGYVVKERLPAGWKLVKASPQPAAGQVTAEEVKWLVPGGTGAYIISYTAQIPAQAKMESDAEFVGTIVISRTERNSTQTIRGDNRIKMAGRHWADGNGDGVIDDTEIMPAYYLTEEMKDFGLDWKTIEIIWSGKGYRWDSVTRQYVTVK